MSMQHVPSARPAWVGRLVPGAIALAIFVFASNSFYIVPQTDVAFVTRFGRVMDAPAGPVGPGLHFKLPLVDNPDRLRITTDTFELPEKKAFTRDTQEITLRVGVTYRVPTTAAYHLLYEVGKAGNIDIHSNIILLSNEVVREVLSKHSVTEIAGEQREIIVGEIKAKLAEVLASLLQIEVSAVQLNSLDFSPQFKEAMNQATLARSKAITAQQDADRAQIEAITRVTQAKAEADAQVARAEGQARSQITQARAEAEGNLLKAKADGDATRLRGEGEAQATRARLDATGGMDNYVRQMEAQAKMRWTGGVPQFMLGGSGGAGSPMIPIILPMTPPAATPTPAR